MTEPTLAPIALHGWYMLTQFVNLPSGLGDEGSPARDERLEELADLLSGWEDLGEEGWSGLYRLVGGGSDYMLLHFRPTLEALGEVERTLRIHPSAGDVIPINDYVSVVELGLYTVTEALLKRARDEGIELRSEEWQAMVDEAVEDQASTAFVRRRLYPRQPDGMPYVCFYPMNKRRDPGQNWYTLSVEERAALMHDHGATGRTYAGRVSQIISGSVGLDDWEWAVTLFTGDPLEVKDLVTEMRYDEATALYGEFGSFWVGHRIATGDIAGELKGE